MAYSWAGDLILVWFIRACQGASQGNEVRKIVFTISIFSDFKTINCALKHMVLLNIPPYIFPEKFCLFVNLAHVSNNT